MENLRSVLDKDIFNVISISAEELGVDAYVIGGYVRDRIMNRIFREIMLRACVLLTNHIHMSL